MIKRMAAVVVMLAVAAVSGIAPPAQAMEDPTCMGKEDYVRSVHTIQLVVNRATDDLDLGNLQEWTPEDMDQSLTAAENALLALESLTPPSAAENFHSAMGSFFETMAELFVGMQETGFIGMLPYLEDLNAAAGEVETIGLAFEEACFIAVIDHDNDGILEIGAGNPPATPTSGGFDPNAPLGSFANPIPVGQSIDVGGGWEITVVEIRADDTEAVLAENRFNDPPIEGRQFFVADVLVENTGSTPASFDGNYRLRATGLEGDYRAFAPDDRCGVVANEWEERAIAPGEQAIAAICWSVPTTDVPNIRLYDEEAVTEARVYLALTPVGGATPAPATPASGSGN